MDKLQVEYSLALPNLINLRETNKNDLFELAIFFKIQESLERKGKEREIVDQLNLISLANSVVNGRINEIKLRIGPTLNFHLRKKAINSFLNELDKEIPIVKLNSLIHFIFDYINQQNADYSQFHREVRQLKEIKLCMYNYFETTYNFRIYYDKVDKNMMENKAQSSVNKQILDEQGLVVVRSIDYNVPKHTRSRSNVTFRNFKVRSKSKTPLMAAIPNISVRNRTVDKLPKLPERSIDNQIKIPSLKDLEGTSISLNSTILSPS